MVSILRNTLFPLRFGPITRGFVVTVLTFLVLAVPGVLVPRLALAQDGAGKSATNISSKTDVVPSPDSQLVVLAAPPDGKWTGPVNQPGASNYSMVLNLKNCASQTVCGTAYYPELGCTETVTFLGDQGDLYRFSTVVTSDPRQRCTPKGTATFKPLTGNKWEWNWYHLDGTWSLRAILLQEIVTYTISGRIVAASGSALEGVTVSDGAGHTTTSNSSGNYQLTQLPATTYTLSASKNGYTFAPAARQVTVPPNAGSQNFTGTPLTYTVSGRIVDSQGAGLAGVSVSCGTKYTTSEADGRYTISGLETKNYYVTAYSSIYIFFPTSHMISVPPDYSDLNFTANLAPKVVSTNPAPQAADVRMHPVPSIGVLFNTAMDLSTLNAGNIRVTDQNGQQLLGWVRADGDRTMRWAPLQRMQFGTQYTVSLLRDIRSKQSLPINFYQWSFTTEPINIDLAVEKIDVNQGTSNPAKAISGRDTVIRVFVQNRGSASIVENVGVRLYVYQTSPGPRTLVATYDQTAIVKKQPSPADLVAGNDAVNFRFSACASAMRFLPGYTYEFLAEVDPDRRLDEGDENNNGPDGAISAAFIKSPAIKILIVQIMPPTPSALAPAPSAIPSLQFIERMWLFSSCPPNSSVQISERRTLFWPWHDSGSEDWELFRTVEILRRETASDYVFVYYGSNLIDDKGNPHGTGYAYKNRRLAVIYTRPDPGPTPALVAHEAGHLFGVGEGYVDEPNRCISWVEDGAFDLVAGTSGASRNNTDGHGNRRASIMCADILHSYWPGAEVETLYWADHERYDTVLSNLIGKMEVQASVLPSAAGAMLISGLIYEDGAVSLNPVSFAPHTLLSPGDTGSYVLEIQNATGQVLISQQFEADFTPPSGVSRTQPIAFPFAFAFAYQPDAHQVVLQRGSTQLATITASAQPPTINLLMPNGGETCNEVCSVAWQAADPDGDPITVDLYYSSDGGATTDLAAAGLTGSSYTVDFSTLAGSSTAVLYAVASDGLHTAVDQSDLPFQVERKAPNVQITEPAPDRRILQGQPLTLQGYAYDAEDGILSATQLAWSSSINGALGMGSELIVSDLAPGQHTVTLIATDKDSQYVRQAIMVLVEADSDGDGIGDEWEQANLLQVGEDDSWQDLDFDGLDSRDEYALQTDPNNSDSDGDGLNDGAEVRSGSNPLGADMEIWRSLYLPRVNR